MGSITSLAVRRMSLFGRWLKAGFFLLCVCGWVMACGNHEANQTDHEITPVPAPVEDAGDSVEPSESSQITGTEQRAPAPDRLMASRLTPLGPWWPELRAQVDPGNRNAPWPEEQLAILAERTLQSGLDSWGKGVESTLGAFIGPRSAFSGSLAPPDRPLSPAKRVATGAYSVGTYPDDGGSEIGIGGARSALDPLFELFSPRQAEVEVWVNHVGPLHQGIQSTHVLLRISGPTARGLRQLNLEWQVDWRVGAQRVTLARVRGMRWESVYANQRLYQDRTLELLGNGQEAPSWLSSGARESSARTDNQVAFTDVHLGMHGAAVGDIDGDGLEDIYLGRHGGIPNQLLLHQADGTVRDIAHERNVDFLEDTSGVLIVDLDGDGARDLLLGIGADIAICWNDGQGFFPSHLLLTRDSKDKVYSLAVADADGDGDLDLYDTRYFADNYGGGVPTPYHDARNGGPNSFWRNLGERRIVEDTEAVGLDHHNDRFSLAALWEDVDVDGDLDLYVVNDFGENNLYLNTDGHFEDIGAGMGLGDMAAGMGISPSDVNQDGLLDLYVSNMHTAAGQRITTSPQFQPNASERLRAVYRGHTRGNSLLINAGGGQFRDASLESQASAGGWAWGAIHVDMGNQGADDFAVPNGFLTGSDSRDLASFFWRCVVNASPEDSTATEEYLNAWAGITRLTQVRGYCWNGLERNYAYLATEPGRFVDASRISGLDFKEDGRVALRLDWDGDGRLDLALKNRTAPIFRYLHNQVQAAGQFISFELRGLTPNTEAVGALVEVRHGENHWLRRVYAGEGFLSGQSKRLHFGLGSLGADDPVDWVRVTWPDGTLNEVTRLAPGALYSWQYGAKEPVVMRDTASHRSDKDTVGLATGSGKPTPSLVALERVPCSSLSLPSYSGTHPTLADLAGELKNSSTLIYLWGSWSSESLAGLKILGGAADSLREAGLRVHPLSMDGPRHSAQAEQLAQAAMPLSPGGRIDSRTRPLIELLLQSTLGIYDDLQLPLGILVDPSGAMVAVHFGSPQVDVLEAQARALQVPLPRDEERWTQVLTGGHWLKKGPARRFNEAINFLMNDRSEKDFARELQEFVDRR